MALTPDDVVTKQFQHVRFKDGFDPDEVDDFCLLYTSPSPRDS